MRILLLGDYSNVHATLAEGLRALGHECVVASDGDGWKDYPRDIDLRRDKGLWGKASFFARLMAALPKFRGFDIVQIINPMFLELKAERIMPFYNYLRRHNKKMVMGAFGMDYYWCDVSTNLRPLRYSDFNFGDTIRKDAEAELYRNEWIGTAKGQLNQAIAADCDFIVSGLYEYWATYNAVPSLKDKMTFIPFPIKLPSTSSSTSTSSTPQPFNPSTPQPINVSTPQVVGLFVGIQPNRSAYKGTDIMLEAAKAVQQKHPDRVDLRVVQGVPFDEYQRLMDSSDAILDQLYSYTPAMNSLLAMSKGIINIGGAEPENYDILNEEHLRPIINVQPTFESCYEEIERIVLHPELIPELKRQSIQYVRKHHDYIKVAKQYDVLYKWILQ